MNKLLFGIGFCFVILLLFPPLNRARADATLGGYPQIFNLWGGSGYNGTDSFFAGFNLYAMYRDGSSQLDKDNADRIHAINSQTKILITADIIPAHDPGYGLDVQPQWWSATPGTPDYACILRNSQGVILRDDTYNAAINNLTNSYCRDVLVNHFINRWNTSGGHFDGWQVDQAGNLGVSWQYGTNIDANVDGQPDNLAQVDQDFTAGLIDILTRLRATFPNIIIHANDSPASFGNLINGRLFEMDLKRYLDKEYTQPWPQILNNWTPWTSNHILTPNTTGMMNSPLSSLITSKYTFQNIWDNIKPAMLAEYSADYNRMRFGLASALMAGGMYSYDLSGFMYGVNWWYDEYGTRGQPSTTGYLGQPTDNATHISTLTTPNQVVNGNFSAGTNPWFISTSGTDVVAIYTIENETAKIHLNGSSSGWITFRQNYVSVEVGKYYTVSFRARANSFRYGSVRIQRAGGTWENLTNGQQIQFGTEWTNYHLPLKATGTGTNGTLLFDTGILAGDIFLDDISFQEGSVGVWQRHFDNGTVLLNEGPQAQTITLDKTYRKLTGNQAPLYFQRLDDNQAVVTGPWTSSSASFDQWGLTVHTINAPNTSSSLTYTFTIPNTGEYEVLSWIAPSANYSRNVTVSINGVNVNVDQTSGELGWHSLGKFNFNQSATIIVRPTGTGVVVGDAFKIVSTARYNDGSLVNSVTLQPDDAIILVNTNSPLPSPTPFTHCQPLGDVDCNGKVNIFDASMLIFDWALVNSRSDLDDNQVVNQSDMRLLLNNYGLIH